MVGAAALAWPFIASMKPDAETIAAGAPIDVDLSPIGVGQIVNVFWRGKLIFVRRLSDKEITDMKAVPLTDLSDPAPFYGRVKQGHDQW
ncbi:ubiquinol-cytochrome c reductase iron-sulfur subunit N-terminal domain-containing protein, partial [Enterococcus gallinarum]|uniref:ubiquinol-cytochrome c reductase iron-sulfur subunit N-terminal domain-containing protein n=1 Tax=Enterococcus gallinarum TaxID=1353 RepID=UPI003D0B4053